MNVRAFVAIGVACAALTLTGCAATPVDSEATPVETTETETQVDVPDDYIRAPELDFYNSRVLYEVYYTCIGTTAGYIATGPYRDLPPISLWAIDNSPECVG